MRQIDDQLIDTLIAETLDRRRITESINAQVMRDIRRTVRRRALRRWIRIVTFSFGVPLGLTVFGLLLRRYVLTATEGVLALVCTVIPAAAVIYVTWHAVMNFSIGQGVIKSPADGLKDEV